MSKYIDVNPRFGRSTSAELVYDVEAINSSIENILGTIPGERLFQPNFGSNIHTLLFEPINDDTAADILFEIVDAIENWEPRVTVLLDESTVDPYPDKNLYEVVVRYKIITTQDTATFSRQFLTGALG